VHCKRCWCRARHARAEQEGIARDGTWAEGDVAILETGRRSVACTHRFSSALLAEAFSKAPSYDIRESLLTKALVPRYVHINDLPVKIFSPIFNRSKMAAGLPRAIFF
jgi:hypothetical protein